jgi:hypothetical protein
MKLLDTDQSGTINFDEFLIGVRVSILDYSTQILGVKEVACFFK